MSLPETVEYPLVPGDPIPAALLVKLQEGVVGDHHANRRIVLGPASWTPKQYGRGAGGTLPQLGDSQWVWGGGAPCILVAPLPVPAGHEVTLIEWFYTRGGAGTVTRSMYSRTFTGSAEVAVLGPTADSTGAAWAGASNALAYVATDYYFSTLEIALANAAHIFLGAIVQYRKLP